MPYTKTPAEVYGPVDNEGRPRGAAMGDALVLAEEMVREIVTETAARIAGDQAEAQARQLAVGAINSRVDALDAHVDSLEVAAAFGLNWVSGISYPSLAALNAAGLADGSRAIVWTEGEERDAYEIVSGSAVWRGKIPDVGVAAIIPALAAYPYPVDPIMEMEPLRASGWGGRAVPGRDGMSTSVYAWTSGQMPPSAAFAGTVTPRFGAGASSGGLAQRIQFTATGQVFYFFNGAALDGDYAAAIKVRSTPGAGPQTVRFGEPADSTNVAVTEAGWTTIKRTLVAGSRTVRIAGDGTNTPDILVDEVRLHRDDGSVDLPLSYGRSAALRSTGRVGDLPLRSNVISVPEAGAVWKGGRFPEVTSLSEYTVMLAFRRDGNPAGTEQIVITPADTALGTTTNTLRIGVATSGAMSVAPATPFSIPGQSYCDGAWQIFAITAWPGEVRHWHYGVQTRKDNPATPGFDFTVLRAFGQTDSSAVFKGDVGEICVWDTALQGQQLRDAFTAMQKRLEARGHRTGRGDLMLISEGDSRSAVTTSPQGPSFQWLQFDPAVTEGRRVFGCNFASSGDGIDNVENDVPAIAESIRGAVAMGRIPIVSLLIGVNNHAAIIASPSTYLARLEAVWAQYKAAGAKVIACTELPMSGENAAAWNAARATLNGLIRSSTVPDAVADIGDSSTVMGADSSPVDHAGTYWADNLHPTTAGHQLLAPILWAAIKSLS